MHLQKGVSEHSRHVYEVTSHSVSRQVQVCIARKGLRLAMPESCKASLLSTALIRSGLPTCPQEACRLEACWLAAWGLSSAGSIDLPLMLAGLLGTMQLTQLQARWPQQADGNMAAAGRRQHGNSSTYKCTQQPSISKHPRCTFDGLNSRP